MSATFLGDSPVGERDAVLEQNEHRRNLAVMNISHAADLWLGAIEISERTEDTYRRLLNKLADDQPSHVDVRDITLAQLRSFLDRQARLQDGGARKASTTIAQNISIVCRFFDWLSKEEIIGRNPTRRNGERVIMRPRLSAPEDNDNVTTISSVEVMRLLETSAAMGWPERMAVAVAVYSGARRRALSNLRVHDYDPVGRRLSFMEKGGKRISKPVPHELAHIIEAAIIAGVYETDDDYLIPSRASQRRDGTRDDRIIWNLIKDVAAKAGVRTHVHALRAAFAVHYLETNPGGLIALQKLMGHQRQDTTLVYLRRLDRQQQMETVRDLSWGAPTDDSTGEGAESPSSGRGATLAYAARGGSVDQAPGMAAPTPEPTSPQIAEELLEAKPLTEKEGFEPSFAANPVSMRVGIERAGSAPRETVDSALLEKVRAIRDRAAEVAE